MPNNLCNYTLTLVNWNTIGKKLENHYKPQMVSDSYGINPLTITDSVTAAKIHLTPGDGNQAACAEGFLANL